jgi:DNA modification methylase
MSESFLNGKVTLHRGDCLEVLPTLEECSIDSCVTDPPYFGALCAQSAEQRYNILRWCDVNPNYGDWVHDTP